MHELAGCRISTPNGDVGGYVTTYAGGVLRIRGDSPLVGVRAGDSVAVTVLDPVRGVCSYAGLVAGLEPWDDGTALDVVVVEDVARHQRRGAARSAYRCSCTGTVEGSAPWSLRVTVLDVSATGVRFMAADELAEGATLTLALPVDGEVLELRLRVVRHEVSSTGVRYGATLVDPPERVGDALYRLVLRLQREEARQAAEHR